MERPKGRARRKPLLGWHRMDHVLGKFGLTAVKARLADATGRPGLNRNTHTTTQPQLRGGPTNCGIDARLSPFLHTNAIVLLSIGISCASKTSIQFPKRGRQGPIPVASCFLDKAMKKNAFRKARPRRNLCVSPRFCCHQELAPNTPALFLNGYLSPVLQPHLGWPGRFCITKAPRVGLPCVVGQGNRAPWLYG